MTGTNKIVLLSTVNHSRNLYPGLWTHCNNYNTEPSKSLGVIFLWKIIDIYYSMLKHKHLENFFHHINNLHQNIKACVCYFLSNFYFSPNDTPSKTMKNVFYFIKKALFILKIFKFLYFNKNLTTHFVWYLENDIRCDNKVWHWNLVHW